jgi:hypothetical protein
VRTFRIHCAPLQFLIGGARMRSLLRWPNAEARTKAIVEKSAVPSGAALFSSVRQFATFSSSVNRSPGWSLDRKFIVTQVGQYLQTVREPGRYANLPFWSPDGSGHLMVRSLAA